MSTSPRLAAGRPSRRSRRSARTAPSDVPDASLTGTVEAFQKAPNKALSRIDLSGVGQQVDGFDGTMGWASDMNGVRVRGRCRAHRTRCRSSDHSERELKFKELYPKMTVTGREAVGKRRLRR